MTPSDLRTTHRSGPSATPQRLSTSPRPTLSLVTTGAATARTRHSPLALWHLLSLDAPTVAALWTFAIARSSGLRLPATNLTAPAAIFVAVWMLYAADRILDARLLDTRPSLRQETPRSQSPLELLDLQLLDLQERHLFHHRHRRAFLLTILAASCILAALLHRLGPATLHLYTLLAALLGAWLLLIHARPLHNRRLPKELAVGLFFPAAVFIPTVARLPQLQLALLTPAALLAGICTLNCLFLYAWEHPGLRPFAHLTTRWSTRHLPSLTAIVAIASCALLAIALLAPHSLDAPLHRSNALLASCTLFSALLLLLLHELRHTLKPVHLRALADLVLLTPALILPLGWLLAR